MPGPACLIRWLAGWLAGYTGYAGRLATRITTCPAGWLHWLLDLLLALLPSLLLGLPCGSLHCLLLSGGLHFLLSALFLCRSLQALDVRALAACRSRILQVLLPDLACRIAIGRVRSGARGRGDGARGERPLRSQGHDVVPVGQPVPGQGGRLGAREPGAGRARGGPPGGRPRGARARSGAGRRGAQDAMGALSSAG